MSVPPSIPRVVLPEKIVLQMMAKESRILDAEKIRQDFIKSKRLPRLSSSISSPISDAR